MNAYGVRYIDGTTGRIKTKDFRTDTACARWVTERLADGRIEKVLAWSDPR